MNPNLNDFFKKLNRFKDLDAFIQLIDYLLKMDRGLGVNLPILLDKYLRIKGLDDSHKSKLYYRLYRFLRLLSQHGFVELRKVDGLVWAKPTNSLVDLISMHTQNSNLAKMPRDRAKTSRRLNRFKFEARMYVSRKRVLRKKDWETIFGYFVDYVEDTDKRVLVFLDPDGVPRVSRYKHRFLKRMLKKHLRKFDMVFDKASREHKEGVFLTLTMDPKKYDSLVDAARSLSKSWNRFMSWLRKKLGFRPLYIKVLEFQDSGNPHLHVVLFGVKRIGDHYELTERMKKWGFGEIHFEYQIVNRKGVWTWKYRKKGRRPKTRSDAVRDYLKKYIRKNFEYPLPDKIGLEDDLDIEDMKISLYFATDSRFYTYSRALSVGQLYKVSVEYGWVFMGSYYYYDLPDWAYRRILEFYDYWDLPPPLDKLNETVFQ